MAKSDKDVVLAFIRALMHGIDDEIEITSCITNIELAKQIIEMSQNVNLLLSTLFQRPKLHSKLSAVGWGSNTQDD